MTKHEYQEYLASEHWRDTRRRKLRQAEYQCQECGCKGVRLHVHHLTYERLGREWDSDLKVLCENCHRDAHGSPLENWEAKVMPFLRGE
jgi:5-methylcytosine-specific restriction endonuclease McrA